MQSKERAGTFRSSGNSTFFCNGIGNANFKLKKVAEGLTFGQMVELGVLKDFHVHAAVAKKIMCPNPDESDHPVGAICYNNQDFSQVVFGNYAFLPNFVF